MSPVALLIVVLVCIAISVIVGNKLNINIGILAMAFAYIIGTFIMGTSTKDLISYWPTSTMFTVLALLLFFGYVNETGASEKLAMKLLYKTRNHPAFMPFTILIIAAILGLMGSNPFATAAICCPIVFSICSRTNKNPLLGFAMFTCGTNMFCYVPWASAYAVQKNKILEGPLAENADKYMVGVTFGYMVFFFLTAVLMYIWLKGPKYMTVEDEIKPVEPLDSKQKLAVVLVIIFVIVVVLPTALTTITGNAAIKAFSRKLDVGLVAAVFAAIAALCRLADTKKVITKQVPWTTIVMICGVSMLITVASKGGAIDIVGDWIGSSLPKALICPILFVIGGILSMFVSTNNVAIPTLFTLVPSIFAASRISPVILYMAIAVGCSSTGCFPFSGSGSFGLAMCSDEKLVKPLFNGQMKMAAFQLIIGIILSFVLSLVI